MFTEPRRLSPRVHTVPPRRTAAFIDHRLDGMAVVSRSDIAKIKILEPVFAPPCDAILPEFCGVLRSIGNHDTGKLESSSGGKRTARIDIDGAMALTTGWKTVRGDTEERLKLGSN